MKYATREYMEEAFLGKLCNVIVSEEEYAFYSKISQKDKDYIPEWKIKNSNGIDEQRIDKNWWAKGFDHIKFRQDDVVLVIDILRNPQRSPPVWSAAILHQEKTYLIDIDRLLLSEKNK